MQERKPERVYQKIINKLDPYLRGAAHILDIGGTLGPRNPYEGLSPDEATAQAFRSDWQKIGNDLRTAMDTFDEELRQQGITPPERNK